MKGILRSAKKRDYLYYVYSLVESSIQSSMDYKEEHNLPASFMPQSTIIFDLEDLAMKHITYKPGDLFPIVHWSLNDQPYGCVCWLQDRNLEWNMRLDGGGGK